MTKYYELYKILILATAFTGVYFPSVEKICGTKWYIKSLKFLFVLPGTALPLYLASSLKYQFFDDDELGSKIYGYLIIIYCSFTTFTVYSLYYYKNRFVKIFELWDSMFQDELFPEDRQKLLTKNRRVTNGWLKIFGSLCILGFVGYFTVTYGNPDKKLAHPTGFPYRYQSPDFELMNTLDLIVCTFGFASKTGSSTSVKEIIQNAKEKNKNYEYSKRLVTCDSMTMVFLSLEEAQIQHLKSSLARILDTIEVTDSGQIQVKTVKMADTSSEAHKMKAAFEETDKNVRIWISHHHQILRFHEELQQIFSVLLSVKFFVFVMIICLVCFLGLAGRLNTVEIFLACVFCCNNYALFYVNVTFANSITEAAETIFEKAFEKAWYLYPRRQRIAFHIIIMRSHRPVQYMAFKIYPLSSRSFLKILSSAYSFFTFMLQVNRKKGDTL